MKQGNRLIVINFKSYPKMFHKNKKNINKCIWIHKIKYLKVNNAQMKFVMLRNKNIISVKIKLELQLSFS